MNRKWMFLFLMLTGLALTSGCWSKKELTDIAFVSALGIDKNEEGKYVGTIQLINPGNVAGGLQGGGGEAPSITTYSSTGDNIVEMSRRASTKISRRLYYSHTNLLVINEELAKEEGIINILDAFDRDPEFRTTATIIIAHDSKAADIVNTLTGVDKIPANKVIKTLKITEQRWGEHMEVSIQEGIKNLISPGKEPVITGFRMTGNTEQGKKLENIQQSAVEENIQADGLAVFKDGKLVDWFQGETARGVTWILDKIKVTDINISWEGEQEAVAYEVLRQKTKVSANMKNGQPKISIHVDAEGDIGEVMVPVDLTDPSVLLNIEKTVEKKIQKEINDAIQRAQKNQTDIFGFGEAVHRSDPKAWKKLKQDWNNVHFPQLKADVTVEAFVRRTGLRNKPYFFRMESNQ
ncbi:Ger(x)C family spore germination protein [Peribacillus asahii]|uniref:Ger(X)C family spore germination protein n=1 Tax=Peribacillus asahii TaxID=228899 RepID=A0A398B5Y3_9BACI|nr:Ger(x)C family spore germination protein [Peribacillus asahii]RID85345.1 Ger(x)C family spore germination protein [Peribacillus asahii]